MMKVVCIVALFALVAVEAADINIDVSDEFDRAAAGADDRSESQARDEDLQYL